MSGKATLGDELRDTLASTEAAHQRALLAREAYEATQAEVHLAEASLATLAERFPWHLDTLKAIRERLEELQGIAAGQQRALAAAEGQQRRWAERLAACERVQHASEAASQVRQLGQIAVVAPLPAATPQQVEQLREVVDSLRQTVERLEQDNAQLRGQLNSVESNHVYLLRRLREQEDDLVELRVAQERLASYAEGEPLWQESDAEESFADEPTPAHEPPPATLHAVRRHTLASAMDTARKDEDPELVFDDQFDRDVSALIRLMGKYQVQRLPLDNN